MCINSYIWLDNYDPYDISGYPLIKMPDLIVMFLFNRWHEHYIGEDYSPQSDFLDHQIMQKKIKEIMPSEIKVAMPISGVPSYSIKFNESDEFE